jgi:tRNA G18 (ribose-2'-O)-methylase SpoU
MPAGPRQRAAAGSPPTRHGRVLRVSTRNSAFQVLESLRANRQKRHATGTFLVEGVRPIALAVEHGWDFDAIAYDGSRPHSAWAAGVLTARPAATRYAMTGALVAELSAKDEPSELLAVVRMRHTPVAAIAPRPDLLVVAADRISNPGNLGTLIRSCDALGAHALVITGHAADPHDPAAITASRGSLFALPVCVADAADVRALVDRTRAASGVCRLVGGDETAAVLLSACDLSAAVVCVLGNETHGLSRAYRDHCDDLVRIPMTGAASSLNVAAAGSIVLYEAARQRASRTEPR